MSDAMDFLNSSGGESFDPVKFVAVGDHVQGTIISEPRPIQRPNLNDGSPEPQLPINLETKEGLRTLWVRKGFLAGAIADAVKQSGANGLLPGGTLLVQFSETRDTGKPQPAKVYRAKYTPPAEKGVSVDDLFENGPEF